jgi:hypothetical protein
MATSLSLENDSSLAQGYIKVNGTTAATLTTSGITGNLTGNLTGSLTQGGSLTLATAQTASGTAVDFTSIPSWVKRITVMLNSISTNGTSAIRIQIGGSSVESSGYNGCSLRTASDGSIGMSSFSNGFDLSNAGSAPLNYFGNCVLSLITNNIWSLTGILSYPTANSQFNSLAGTKQTSSSLSIVRITTANGTDTFDAGTINISYEG